MAIERDGPAWLVVDHELLVRLGPASSRAEWTRMLRRTGLWDLPAAGGEEGEALLELQNAVRTWEPAPLRAVVEADGARIAAAIAVGGGLVLGMLFRSFVPVLAGVGLSAWALVVGPAGMVRLGPLRAPAEPRSSRGAERATRALRRLLSRTFVQAVGERLVENTPHRAYLQLRLEELDAALRAADAHLDELRTVRSRVQSANRRVGRPEEDVETQALEQAVEHQLATRARVAAVRDLLATRLADLDAQLERLRAIAERRALSERVSRLTQEAAAQDPLELVAARVEVDVAGIEGRIRELALDAGDADLRLRAVLEVVGASRGPS